STATSSLDEYEANSPGAGSSYACSSVLGDIIRPNSKSARRRAETVAPLGGPSPTVSSSPDSVLTPAMIERVRCRFERRIYGYKIAEARRRLRAQSLAGRARNGQSSRGASDNPASGGNVNSSPGFGVELSTRRIGFLAGRARNGQSSRGASDNPASGGNVNSGLGFGVELSTRRIGLSASPGQLWQDEYELLAVFVVNHGNVEAWHVYAPMPGDEQKYGLGGPTALTMRTGYNEQAQRVSVSQLLFLKI
ncbi:unnamed protein product, partial [Protopolystoma xenopodis]